MHITVNLVYRWCTLLHYFQSLHTQTPNLEHLFQCKFLTFRTDLADFLHIVLGAIVDGMRDSALADSLVLAG